MKTDLSILVNSTLMTCKVQNECVHVNIMFKGLQAHYMWQNSRSFRGPEFNVPDFHARGLVPPLDEVPLLCANV